jgi:hypothetical protein
MRFSLRRCSVLALVLAGVFLAGESWSASAQPEPALKKYALLVGCSEYQNLGPSLRGPVNDVPLMTRFLKERFGFPDANITQLVGWPDDPKQRPTYANICAAFDDLVAKAGPDTQIVILLSGHGTQIPIPEGQDPLDPKNYEPDGLDEVFLPADADPGTQKNLLIDDQIGVWLDKLRDKGAAVWIIFDCCHSGTMDRALPDKVRDGDREQTREVNAIAIGLTTAKAWDDAVDRAAKAVKKAQNAGLVDKSGKPLEPGGFLDRCPKDKNKGSVVAFYGAQSFEKAPELPRPEGASRARENWYGMLTWTLIQTLEQQKGVLTYRELAQALVGQYAAERAGTPPTPFAEGDLDREVLGLKTWPQRSALVLKKDGTELSVAGGALLGLTPGSILAVYPSAKDKPGAKDPVGYVQITTALPTQARVKAVGHGGKAAVKAADLPDGGRCEVLTRDFGDMKLRLALGKPANAVQAKLLKDLADGLSKELRELVKIVDNQADAQWILTVHKKEIQLREADGRQTDKDRNLEQKPGLPRVFAVAKEEEGLKALIWLERDLQRLFTWQNLWRLAGTLGNAAEAKTLGLKFEFSVIDADGKETPLTNGEPLAPGQKFRLTVHNKGLDPLWIRVCNMDGSFGIQVKPLALEPGQSISRVGKITSATDGKEGYIVLAGPLGKGDAGPDLTFLNQAQLTSGEREIRDKAKTPDTPFGKLLRGATLGSGARFAELDAPTNPVMLTVTWVTVKANK